MQNFPLANRYTAAYSAAILLHVLFLLFLEPARRLIDASASQPVMTEADPLAFEFVESLANAEDVAPDETRFLSDRNATSRDRSRADLPRSDLAHSEGIAESKEAFETRIGGDRSRPGNAHSQTDSRQPGDEAGRRLRQDQRGAEGLRRQGQLTQAQREEAVFGSPIAAPASIATDNTASRALDEGALQLSTYSWKFAPYLKYLKRRIQSNIFPPAAFSRLGAIEGKNRLRFRIYPDGRLEGLTVLVPGGSNMLLTTSVKAVELSAPFRPLPEDFPEPFLGIWASFAYIIDGEAR